MMEESFTMVLVGGGKFWMREGAYIFPSTAQANGGPASFFLVSFFQQESYVGSEQRQNVRQSGSLHGNERQKCARLFTARLLEKLALFSLVLFGF